MKKTITTITLAITILFGATFANAGILLTDRTTNSVGILVTDRSNSAAGILVTDRQNQLCTAGKGIVVTDILGTVSSIVGILITDLTGRSEGCTSGTLGRRATTDRAVGILITD
jgi:hypothetical protein